MKGAEDHSEYEPPERIIRLPSWLAGQVAAVATRLVGDALAADGLRRQHYVVLSALLERGAVSQAALGRRLAIDRSDMHTLLGELEQAGLVERVRDELDNRRILLELTIVGVRMLKRLDRHVEAAQQALVAPLSPAERRELDRLLTRLVEHHSGQRFV
jgi:DNA-binding MarR family transcriptional regulator